MLRKRLKRCFAYVLAAAVAAAGIYLPQTNAYAAENESVISGMLTETIAAPETSAAYRSKQKKAVISASTVDGVTLTDGNAVEWIDRVNIADYAKELYQTLENNISVASDGTAGMLIDVTKGDKITGGYAIPVVEITGTAEGKKALTEKIDENLNCVTDNIAAAYYAFDRDHAEVFWLDGDLRPTSYYTASLAGTTYYYTQTVYLYLQDASSNYDIRAEGYRDVSQIKEDILVRDRQISEITKNSQNLSYYKAIKAMNQWLTENNEYNTYVADGNDSAAGNASWECISALQGKEGIEGPACEGYARAFKVLCDELGIPCVLVDGTATSSDGTTGAHMWNYVQMEDNNWYGVDITWNDPADSTGRGALSGYENENYLLVGADTNVEKTPFSVSHPVSNRPTSSLAYTNGPELCSKAYDYSTQLGEKEDVDKEPAVPGYSEEQTPTPTATEEAVTATPTATEEAVTATPMVTAEVVTATPTATEEAVMATPTATEEAVTAVPTETTVSVTAMPTETEEAVTPVPTKTAETVTAVPTETTAPVTAVPTKTAETVTPVPTKTAAPASVPTKEPKTADGSLVMVSGAAYKVQGSAQAVYIAPKKSAATASVPAAVTIEGKTYVVISIAANAFKNNKKIRKVTIAKNVKKIGKNVFVGCKNLKTIIIRSKKLSVSQIGKKAFCGLPANAVVKVPKSKVAAYKKIFRKKGLSKKIKIKRLI